VAFASVILSSLFDHRFDLRRYDLDVSLTGRRETPFSRAR
jgi:hypothetical protein